MEIPWGRALISSFSLRLFFLLRLSASMKSLPGEPNNRPAPHTELLHLNREISGSLIYWERACIKTVKRE